VMSVVHQSLRLMSKRSSTMLGQSVNKRYEVIFVDVRRKMSASTVRHSGEM